VSETLVILIFNGQLNLLAESQVNSHIRHGLLTSLDPDFIWFLLDLLDEETGSVPVFKAIKVR
jgi:hypothetical protein